jgi:hypothetical protein
MSLGKREPVDMLNISYTLQPYLYSNDADTRAEQIDSYIRLDRDLDRLFRSIDASGPGMDNTLIFIAGTPQSSDALPDDKKWKVPTGEFSPSRAVSLLKMNLMSIFGNGDWVVGYHDRQIYLNRALIKERGLSLDDMRRESVDFLRRMSGVTYAATVDQVVSAYPAADNPYPHPRNVDIDTAGDIFLTVAPGWVIAEESSTPATVQRYGNASSAAFILYPSISAQTITLPVDARAIAPTVAAVMRIRPPNGSQVAPLRF